MIDGLTITAIVLIVILVVMWIFYNIYTNRIIKDLIAENYELLNSLKALEKDNKILTECIVNLRTQGVVKALKPEHIAKLTAIINESKESVVNLKTAIDNSKVDFKEW